MSFTHKHYRLTADHKVVEEPDLITWGRWLESSQDRILRHTYVGPLWISTVFLGLDHRFNNDGSEPPILFETMVFDGDDSIDQDRYVTYDEAMAGHAKTVARLVEEYGRDPIESPREVDLALIERMLTEWKDGN